MKLKTDGLLDPACISYKQQQAADLFGKGRAAMFVNWDMMTIIFRDKSQTPYAVRLEPQQCLAGARVSPALSRATSSWPFQVQPVGLTASRKFLRYMMSQPVQRERALQGMPPVRAALYDDAQVKSTLSTGAIFESAAHCYQRPAVAGYEQCSTVISDAIQSVLTGRQTPQLALAASNKRCNELSAGKYEESEL